MILEGDCLDKLKELEDNSVDSIVTDPPYGLVFMGKKWDKSVPVTEVWKECLRVLKPGGYLLSFGGTRTYHKMAVAIEEAGFEIRDMVNWVYSTGFPKSHNIGKAVDKLQGNEREVVGEKETKNFSHHKGSIMGKETTRDNKTQTTTITDTKGTSEWEGWGTALKPAHEPICMARKPLSEKTVAKNVLKWGTGGLNIDESRVGDSGARFNRKNVNSDIYGKYGTSKPTEIYDYGRFPANLCHDNSDEVRECLPNKSERFFKSIIYQAKASKKERNKGCEVFNNNKPMYESHRPNYKNTKGIDTPFAGTGRTGNLNQNNHPTVKPIALMEYLIKMVTKKGGTVLDPFAGSGTTLVAAKKLGYAYIGIEIESEYVKIIEARLKAY